MSQPGIDGSVMDQIVDAHSDLIPQSGLKQAHSMANNTQGGIIKTKRKK